MEINTSDVWNSRWESIARFLQALATEVDAEIELPRRLVLIPLVKSLQDFGAAHFQYFNDYFTKHPDEVCADFPPEFVIRQVIERIATDAQVIQTCIAQRRAGGDAHARDVLLTADKLAWQALRPAVDGHLLPPETTAITYFQKVASIRVIPYASVALIGIPITCLYNSFDYLSIPHEVGHNVYWNAGKFDDDAQLSIQSRLKQQATRQEKAKPAYRWTQEIFADAYGALVAQAPIAVSFQDLEFESSKVEFATDDGRHPLPIVRPEIYAALIGKTDPVLAEKLEDRWKKLLQKRSAFVTTDAEGDWNTVQVAESVENPNPTLIDHNNLVNGYSTIVDAVTDVLPMSSQEPDFPARDAKDLESVYAMFSDAIPAFVAKITEAQIDGSIRTKSWDDWQIHQERNSSLTVNILNSPCTYKWMNIFLAGGWTTEGPQTRDLVGG
ncbi:MAG: hypothetical protein ABI700_27120 [Chloroflexota bacterium]